MSRFPHRMVGTQAYFSEEPPSSTWFMWMFGIGGSEGDPPPFAVDGRCGRPFEVGGIFTEGRVGRRPPWSFGLQRLLLSRLVPGGQIWMIGSFFFSGP